MRNQHTTKSKGYSINALNRIKVFLPLCYQFLHSYQGYTEKASKLPAEEVTVVAKTSSANPNIQTVKTKGQQCNRQHSCTTADLSSARIRVALIYLKAKKSHSKRPIWAAYNMKS